MDGEGAVIGKRAPDFALPDQFGSEIALYETLKAGPVLLAFYPGDFTTICTRQLCNYRDHMQDFAGFGLSVLGISPNPAHSHSRFAKTYEFPFKLLSDPNQKVARAYDCTSYFMFGRVTRAVFIVDRTGFVLYRYVEPTVLTHRNADELIGIVSDLRANKLL